MFRTGESPQTEEQRRAREALNKGVQDFKNGQYDEATQDFLNAKQLDPKLINARLYLATTYTSQYIPGAPSEENVQRGRQAAEEFRGVLALDPQTCRRSTAWGRFCFRWADSLSIPISLRSRSLSTNNTRISGQGIPNPITVSASLTGRFRSARTACSGRSSTCPCAGGN